MAKQARRNRAKQLRLTAARNLNAEKTLFAGRNGAPRIVAVVPLCKLPTDAARLENMSQGDYVVKSVLSALSVPGGEDVLANVTVAGASRITRIERFGQNVAFVVPDRTLFSVLDACRIADYVLFVLSPDEPVDREGEAMIRSIEAQGVSDVVAAVLPPAETTSVKDRKRIDGSLKSFMNHFFPTIDRLAWLDVQQECINLIRSMCSSLPRGVRWRDERSWMLVEDVQWPDHVPVGDDDAKGEVIITGVVRGAALNPDRLIQVGDWGDFQISKITKATPRFPAKNAEGEADAVVASASDEHDDLLELAPEEMVEGDDDDDCAMTTMTSATSKGVLLDDHYYFSDEDEEERTGPRKLPRGTSKYQSAWYLDDVSDGSDVEDVDFDASSTSSSDDEAENEQENGQPGPSSGLDNLDARTVRFAAPSVAADTDFGDDNAAAAQATSISALEAYRAERRKELDRAAAEDAEFPDEVELHPNVLARERLSRYRGLKSLRTSGWSTEPDRPYEPADWARLLEIADYKAARNRVLKQARVRAGKLAEVGTGPGSRVRIHLRDVPVNKTRTSAEAKTGLLSAFGLLQHEHKKTVMNVSISLPATSPFSDGVGPEPGTPEASFYDDDGVPVPIKAKTPLVLQCGPRRLRICPVFSQLGKTRNDVHKFERYLHPGRTVVASFIGPLVWGSVPCVVFRDTGSAVTPLSSTTQPSVSPSSLPFGSGQSTTTATTATTTASSLAYLCTGTVEPPSTSRVIAKRILLTGHPYKIHKRVVTVRYMFFNNADVAWFKALPLRTIRGRTGFIKESLGTHGFFKAQFDGPINPLDAIGMSMYKRVFPRQADRWERDGRALVVSGGGAASAGSARAKGKETDLDDVMMG